MIRLKSLDMGVSLIPQEICYQFCNDSMIKSHQDVNVVVVTCFSSFFMLTFNSQIDDFSAARSSESETKEIFMIRFNLFALTHEFSGKLKN